MDKSDIEAMDSRWNWIYKFSSVTALIAGILFLIAGIELIIMVFQSGTINGSFWSNWLILLFKLHAGFNGIQLNQLYVLNLLDIVIMVFIALTFLGLYVALRRASKIWSIIALIQPFLGILIFIATQSAGRSAVMGGILVISFVMLQNNTFKNFTAFLGIIASLAYDMENRKIT
jgi:hypothetical protein